MKFLRKIFRVIFNRFLWALIGIALLCALIWLYGPLVSFGQSAPLAGELTRIVVIALILIFWLVWLLVRQIRAVRANRAFVAELAAPPPEDAARPGDENLAEVHAKFAGIMEQMKRSKLGGRKFLREMPWYLFIGPPGTGKTTALRQSGLHFPIDLTDDLKGVGGTRNCDWFFTEDAVLIDTAGRYVEQASDPEVDAQEWAGFLELLRKHRGRRALNGVIVAISVLELAGDETSIREHGREIRKRLNELQERLQVRLPVYLMVTKADLVPGFESHFGDLTTREREQVWGATLGTSDRVDGETIDREIRALNGVLEERIVARLADDLSLKDRAEAFRFPSQLEGLTGPLRTLIEAVFGESRYEETPWLRGFYFSSATQEGSPVDRMVAGISQAVGLTPPPPERRAHGETRSFFLRDFLTDLVFPEAGLGTFDPRAEERRTWIFRGTVAGATLVTVIAATLFLFSFLRYGGAINEQERELTQLTARLANVAARQAPTDPLDLPLAIEAANETQNSAVRAEASVFSIVGPTAEPELARAHEIAYDRTLRNILEPRMVALLEATMWRHSRDPEFLLGALKAYQMLTGKAPYDELYLAGWWQNVLPEFAPIDPFPTAEAVDHQLAAFTRMAAEPDKIAPDDALVATALESICTIPLSVRAYRTLISHPNVAALPEWQPSDYAGPNGTRIFERVSGKAFGAGLPGAFTFAGFHDTILELVPEIAAEATLDRIVFAGGCASSSDASTEALERDMLKLYYDEFIAQWDALLRDVRLAPLGDLRTTNDNLKDLAGGTSALKLLLEAVVAETHLNRVDAEGGVDTAAAGKAAKKLVRLPSFMRKGAQAVRVATAGNTREAPEPPGAPVADHFQPIRAAVQEVDGAPPLLTDVETALKQLSNEIQTIIALPNPEEELLRRGGLPQLVGQVTNVAATLPDPVDDWITGIAAETMSLTRDAVLAQLNARWRADVLPFCTSATQGRYPFDQGSTIDVNILDFQRLFGPGGLIDGYINDSLLQYIDTTVRPWRWRADFGLNAELLEPFENARSIRDALFPGGAGPVMTFTLEPKDLSAGASRVTLNVDGQTLSYFNAATRPMPMTWPGSDGTNMITLTFAPVDGSAELITSETGSWAFLRLLRKGQLSRTALPELFNLRLAAGGHAAAFELRANSVENPFDLTMFSGFACPQGF